MRTKVIAAASRSSVNPETRLGDFAVFAEESVLLVSAPVAAADEPAGSLASAQTRAGTTSDISPAVSHRVRCFTLVLLRGTLAGVLDGYQQPGGSHRFGKLFHR